MGTVDLAQDPDGGLVALKRLSLHGTPEELAKARLRIRREAEGSSSSTTPASCTCSRSSMRTTT